MMFMGLLENSLDASILILAIFIVALLMRHKAKIYSYILWVLVFAWLLVPIRIPISVGILPDISLEEILDTGKTEAGQGGSSKDIASQKDLEEGREAKGDLGNALQQETGDIQKEEEFSSEAEAVRQSEASDSRQGTALQNGAEGIQQSEAGDEGQESAFLSVLALQIWPEGIAFRILWGIWIVGVIVLICHGIGGGIRLRRLLESAVHHDIFGAKNVYQCSQIDVPIVSGVFCPRIYLPELHLKPYQRQYILEHEQMHIRRKDPLIKIVSYGLLCLHWFNPLVWLAFAQLERSMEFSCDEAVVERLGAEQKKEYSRTLLAMAAGGYLQKKKGIFAVGFLENNTKKRINNVLAYEHRRRWVTVAVSMVLIGCFVCFLGGRGNFLIGNEGNKYASKQNQGNATKAEDQRKDGSNQQKEQGSGLPVILVNRDGNIIGTHRGNELKNVDLSYINNIENGIPDIGKRGEGYRIESGAFSECKNMNKLVVADSADVTYVAEDAFRGCPSDLEVYCDKDTYLWKRMSELGIRSKEYREDNNTAAMLLDGKRAEDIEQKAYASMDEAQKREMREDFGDLVMSVENYTNLSREEVRQYEGTPYFIMTETGYLAEIEGSVRMEAVALGQNVEYPSEAKCIGMLFNDAYEMEQAEIPAWIEEIGRSAYSGSGLKRIGFKMENGKSQLKKIDVGAFLQCSFSKSPKLVIPEGVTELGAGAFGQCDGLEEIVLPKSLKKIGGDCFAGCTSLKKVTVKSPDVVFDEESSMASGGIFALCGAEYIEEKGEFADSEMVLCGPKGSTAQKYAKEHGIRYKGVG